MNGPGGSSRVVPLLVVDGANVVGSRPDGWWRDRAGEARRLLDKLSQGLTAPYEIVLVLEGAARRAAPSGVDPGAQLVRVVHAVGSGDDAIVALLEDETRVDDSPRGDARCPVIVVTADRGLRSRVEPFGAETRGPGWLWDQLS